MRVPAWATSALSGALGALCVLGVAALVDIRVLLGAIPREEWPAWVQAIGSIAAIGVSSAFAIWVPLHMRALADKDAAQRALNNCTFVSELAFGSLSNVRGVVNLGQFHKRTPDLVQAESDAIQAAASQIPISMLSAEAVNNLHACLTATRGVLGLAHRLANAESFSEAASEIDFDELAEHMEALVMAFSVMEPIRVNGCWMVGDSTTPR